MELRLEPAEARLLRQILVDHASDLRMEIADTDQADLRDAFKRDEATIESLIGRLTDLIGVSR